MVHAREPVRAFVPKNANYEFPRSISYVVVFLLLFSPFSLSPEQKDPLLGEESRNIDAAHGRRNSFDYRRDFIKFSSDV